MVNPTSQSCVRFQAPPPLQERGIGLGYSPCGCEVDCVLVSLSSFGALWCCFQVWCVRVFVMRIPSLCV